MFGLKISRVDKTYMYIYLLFINVRLPSSKLRKVTMLQMQYLLLFLDDR